MSLDGAYQFITNLVKTEYNRVQISVVRVKIWIFKLNNNYNYSRFGEMFPQMVDYKKEGKMISKLLQHRFGHNNNSNNNSNNNNKILHSEN